MSHSCKTYEADGMSFNMIYSLPFIENTRQLTLACDIRRYI